GSFSGDLRPPRASSTSPTMTLPSRSSRSSFLRSVSRLRRLTSRSSSESATPGRELSTSTTSRSDELLRALHEAQPSQEPPLHHEEQRHQRNCGEERGRHQVVPLRAAEAVSVEVEAQREGEGALVGQEQERREEVVPGEGELEEGDDGEGGFGEGEVGAEEDL